MKKSLIEHTKNNNNNELTFSWKIIIILINGLAWVGLGGYFNLGLKRPSKASLNTASRVATLNDQSDQYTSKSQKLGSKSQKLAK